MSEAARQIGDDELEALRSDSPEKMLRQVELALVGHELRPESLLGNERLKYVHAVLEFPKTLDWRKSDPHALFGAFMSCKKPREYRYQTIAWYQIAIYRAQQVRDALQAYIKESERLAAERLAAESEPETQLSLGWVYFIECGGFIKIGYTANVASRLAQHETSNPQAITLLHSEPGTMADEASYHDRFLAHRAKREWFRFEGALKEFLESLR